MKNEKLLDADHTYTAREVAAYLRVTYDTVVRYCRRGLLPGFKVGGQWRISEQDLRHFMRSSFVQHSPALREAPTNETIAGKQRERRAPLPPRGRARARLDTTEGVST